MTADPLARLEASRANEKPTPLWRYPLPDNEVELFVKDESRRPSGSLKHGLARDLLRHALRHGRIRPGRPIVEATSGNLAVSLAYFARWLGIPFTAVVPARTSQAKLARIQRHGGACHLTDPPLAVYERAQRLAEESGGHHLDHLNTLAAAVDEGAERNLAAEILDGLAAANRPPPAWIVAGVGTGATSRAIGRHLRRTGAPTRLAVVDPENSAYFPGWATDCADYATGMPSKIDGIGRPRIEPPFDGEVVDLVIPVPDPASAAAARELHQSTGRPAGASTGACLHGARHLAGRMRERGEPGSVVLLMADGW
ncbi:PLP-dependent cysteine synthase family protein [Crossiella sp. NPDC003009]